MIWYSVFPILFWNHLLKLGAFLFGINTILHITPVIKSLHWLPVSQRIDFKILLLVYKALKGLGPKYMLDLLVPYEASRPLRSSRTGLLCVPRTRTKQGEAAFSYYAPHLWNKLPVDLRSAQTVSSFKSGLKTLLFTEAYS